MPYPYVYTASEIQANFPADQAIPFVKFYNDTIEAENKLPRCWPKGQELFFRPHAREACSGLQNLNSTIHNRAVDKFPGIHEHSTLTAYWLLVPQCEYFSEPTVVEEVEKCVEQQCRGLEEDQAAVVEGYKKSVEYNMENCGKLLRELKSTVERGYQNTVEVPPMSEDQKPKNYTNKAKGRKWPDGAFSVVSKRFEDFRSAAPEMRVGLGTMAMSLGLVSCIVLGAF